ncbi:MAG TPA: condensation domain-containing protein, partial [Segetibacter sp.]|nr:condensation domain-containing protein [Segetibacter sp.]
MKKRPFPLHPAQKDVFIDQLLDVESSHYNIGGYIKLEGTLDKEKFFKVVRSAPQVFDAYKMRFNSDTSNPSFFIEEGYEEMDVKELDFRGEEDAKGAAMNWMQKRFDAAFNIKEDEILFEHVLIRVEDEEHWFFCKYHHLITDGFGFIVWVQYLAARYKSLTTGDSLSISYPSYVEEVLKASDYYKSADYELEGEYWKEKIKNKPERLLQKRHKSIREAGKSSTFIMELPEKKRKLFEELQLNTKVGLQQLTIAALIIYFGKTSNKSDFVFGIPLHKRGSKRLRNIIGMFSGIQPFTCNY